MKSSNNEEWMVVFMTNNLPEAHIIAGRLESEGIPAWVHQQAGANAFGITVGLLGEIRVLVDPQHYEQALAIIEGEVPPEALTDDNDRIIYDDDEGSADDTDE
jgi:hypothetical protein